MAQSSGNSGSSIGSINKDETGESVIDLAKKQITLLYLAIIILLGAIGTMSFFFLKLQKNEAQMISKINILSRKNDQSSQLNQDVQELKTEMVANFTKTYGQIEKNQIKIEIINNNVIGLKEQVAAQIQAQTHQTQSATSRKIISKRSLKKRNR